MQKYHSFIVWLRFEKKQQIVYLHSFPLLFLFHVDVCVCDREYKWAFHFNYEYLLHSCERGSLTWHRITVGVGVTEITIHLMYSRSHFCTYMNTLTHIKGACSRCGVAANLSNEREICLFINAVWIPLRPRSLNNFCSVHNI